MRDEAWILGSVPRGVVREEKKKEHLVEERWSEELRTFACTTRWRRKINGCRPTDQRVADLLHLAMRGLRKERVERMSMRIRRIFVGKGFGRLVPRGDVE